MSSFFTSAQKRVTNVKEFLADAAADNSVRYSAQRGAKHLLYIPYNVVKSVDEAGNVVENKELIAIQGNVHDWKDVDGKYRSVICLKDVIVEKDGVLLNDGSCPICDRVQDGWGIYKYRKEIEESLCNKSGEDREEYMKSVSKNLLDERKAREAQLTMYLLVAKYNTNEKGEPVLGDDGLPEYDLKVMKLSKSRIDKMNEQLTNAGSELEGAELLIKYADSDDSRTVVSQSVTSPVFSEKKLVTKFSNLVNKINEDVAKFNWEDIGKSFREWEGMSVAEAKRVMGDLFEKWDAYQIEKKDNPNAKYLEYNNHQKITNPVLGGADVTQQLGANVQGGVVLPNLSTPNLDVNTAFGVEGGLSI